MKVHRPSELRALLDEHGVRPSRALGQNFLVDANILRILVETADLPPAARVLEIGPGAGVLTEALLDAGARVVAVEKDPRLVALLAARFGGRPDLELVQADALAWDLAACFASGVEHLVSNLPYSAGTRILMRVAGQPPRPRGMTVTLQADVGERLVAAPGTKAYGLLAIWMRRLFDVAVLRRVSPTCFFPVPEVDSVIVRLALRPEPLAVPTDLARFHALSRWAFSHRRKQLCTLGRRLPPSVGRLPGDAVAWIASCGLAPEARPEEVDIDGWVRLADALSGGPA